MSHYEITVLVLYILFCRNREKAAQDYQDVDRTFTENDHKERNLLEPNQTNGSENGAYAEQGVKLKELTSQMTSLGRRLQSQLVSLHETVCKETEASKEGSRLYEFFPPELVEKLQNSTTDLNSEVKVLERYLGQVQELLTLEAKRNNGYNSLNGAASCLEKNQNENQKQKLSLKELEEASEKRIATDEEKWTNDMEFLKNQLRTNGNIIENEDGRGSDGLTRLEKLELDNQNFKKQLKMIKDKLNERGLLDEELASLTNDESSFNAKHGDGSALSELAILQKERKVLLATVVRLQSRESNSEKKDNDIDTCDAAVQCKINILGQVANQGVSLSNELEELRQRVTELQAEVDELEEENKSLEEETAKLTEEKRVLEDSADKLRNQITDALDSSLEEMEHIHREKEDVQSNLELAETDNKKLRDSFVELSRKNADHLESVLDEIERKDSLEDVVDYLSTEVEKLNEINNQAVDNVREACLPRDASQKFHNSNLLSEIKTCKELIDSQRAQIRQLQVDKRDIEDSYINLKREVVILRTKRGEKTPLEYKSAGSMLPSRKTSVERCEFLKQDILRLTKRGTELENVIKRLKSDNSNLEEEKVCLLDSLYHQLERNESLEVQIDKLKSVIKEYNDAKELEESSTNLLLNKQQDFTTSDQDKDVNGNVLESENFAHVCPQESNDYVHENGSTMGETVDESRTNDLRLSEHVQSLKQRVLEVEKENEKVQGQLDDSSKNEKELRELVQQLQNECAVSKNQLKKNQEVSDTLQECLREAHEEKQELAESLDEITEEKTTLEKKIEMTENELNDLKKKHQRLKTEFESAKAGLESTDKAKQQMTSIHAKLSELYEVLTDKDKDSTSEEHDAELQESISLEEQGNSILSLTEKVQKEVALLKKELRRVKVEQEKLKTKFETTQTEKMSLQKYVRELDEKRRQVKSFITKLTEEKEAMSEQMDEIRQQKTNLADALENVYQSKESLQCQLEDALCKQHENSKSITEASAEVQSLKKSLYRMAEERDALKEALLDTTNELQTLKKSEAKWKEKVTGSQIEADQSVEEASDVSGRDDEKEVINRLHLENDGLKKQLEMLKTSKLFSEEERFEANVVEGSPLDSSDGLQEPSESGDEIQVTKASEYSSSPPAYETVVSLASEEPSDDTELLVSSKASSLPQSASPGDQQQLDVRYNELCAEKKALEVQLKQSAEEIEQLKSWFDSMSAEKETMEKEQESIVTENEELLRDLERAKEEEEKLIQRLEQVSKQKGDEDKPIEDLTAALEEIKKENAQLREDLQKQEKAKRDATEALQLSNMRKKTLESEANESWERAEALEKSLKAFKQKNDTLAKDISDLKKEREALNKSSEKLAEDCKTLQQNLDAQNKKLDNVGAESDKKGKELAQLSEQVKSLEEQLRQKSQAFTELEEKYETMVKENEDIHALVDEMKSESEALDSRQEQLLNDYRALEETLAKARTEKSEEDEILEKKERELESTTKELNDEIENLKSSLKAAQDKLDATEDDLELTEEEKDDLKTQVANFKENEKLLKEELDKKSQENSNFQDRVEKLQGDKEFLERKLEEVENESAAMKDELKDLKNQASDLLAFLDRSVEKNPSKQSKGITGGQINLVQYVCEHIEVLSEEKASLATKLEEETLKLKRAEKDLQESRNELKISTERLEKAENTNREIQDDNQQLIQERAELTLQLQEALDKEHTEHASSESKPAHSRDETRLSREISDVRSLIEKLSLQKEKLGAALASKEKQIATVTAEATEKAKMLEHKEKEAESLSLTKAEVAVALEMAKNGSEKLLAELESERNKVESLKQELENIKKQHRNNQQDLTACVSRLEEEKKSFTVAENKYRDLEKRLKKAEEENVKLQEEKIELEENLEAKTANLSSVEMLAKENVLKWKKELDQKDKQLHSLNQDLKKSNVSLAELLRVVDELKNKISELEKQCSRAEKSHKEVIEERNNLQKKLTEETDAKKSLDVKLQELKTAITKHQEETKDLQKQISTTDNDKQSLIRNLKDLEEQIKNKEKRLVDLDRSKQSMGEERAKMKSELALLKDELAKKTLSMEKIQRELSDSKGLIHEGKGKYDQLKMENEDLKKALDSAENKFGRAETTAAKTKEQNEKLKEKLEAIETEMAALNLAFAEAQSKEKTLLIEMKTETERIECELERLTSECEILKEKLDDAAEEKSELEQELELERDQRRNVEEELSKTTKAHEALKISSQTLAQDTENLKHKLAREKEERANIEEELAKLQGENEALKLSSQTFAQDQKDAGNVKESEEIISCAEERTLSSAAEMEFSVESSPDEGGSLEDQLAKQRQINSELNEEVEELNDEKDELNEIIEELRSKAKKLQKKVDDLIEEKESLEDKLDENTKHYKEEIGSLVDGKEELSRKLEVLLKDKNVLREEIKTKEREYSEALEEGKKLEDALEKSAQEVKRLSKELDTDVEKRVEETLAKSKERMKDLEYKLDQLSGENQEIMSELAERKNENSTLRLAVEEVTSAKEDSEMKSAAAEKELYDELDKVEQDLNEKTKTIASLEEEIAEYKRLKSEKEQEEKEAMADKSEKDLQEKLDQLQNELDEKNKAISALEKIIASYKRSRQERERKMQDTLEELQEELSEKDLKISTLEEEIAEQKRARHEQKENIDGEIMSETSENDKIIELQNELAEKDKKIGLLEETVVDYKRAKFEQEQEFKEKEANLATAREEFRKTLKERCEDEERLESLRRANNRLQEALNIAKEKENKLRKELEELKDRQRYQNVIVSEEKVRKTSATEGLESGVEKVTITSSKVSELSQTPPKVETGQLEKQAAALENARKEIAMLESHEQELRGELRKARDQVFDLQLELSDALRALKQKERLHEQERKRFQSTIEDMENEYTKMRSELSSILAMEKNRSSFITVVELKGTLRKAESDMLEAVSRTADLLSRAKNDIRESRRIESEKDSTERSSERARSFIEKSMEEKKDLLKQLDELCKERDRLARRLKRSEGAQILLKQILNESLVEVERFKRLVDFSGKHQKGRSASVGSYKAETSTQELETQSDLTATDLEEAEHLKDCLEELRRNIRGLEQCLDEERSKGEGNLLDYLREKNKSHAEITALKQCARESVMKNESLQSLVSDLQGKLELALKERTAVENEVSEVRYEVEKLRTLSYDERAEKNSLRQANAELKRSLLDTKERDGKVMKESDKVKELKKEKDRLSAENEKLKKNVKELNKELEKMNEGNFAKISKELENANYHIGELSSAKEAAETKNKAIESELQGTKYNLKVLEKEHNDLKDKFLNLEENCKDLDSEKVRLVEDAHSFKLKMDKKNQELLSKLEAKEHEAISLKARVEGLDALQRKLENDVRGLEKDKENFVSRVRSLEYDKERIEAINKQQKAEIEKLLLDTGSKKDLDDKLKSLFSENDRLEEMNKTLETDVRELYKELETKGKEKNGLVQELHEMATKIKQLEKEKQNEASLKEQLAEQLLEKDQAMKTKTKLLSSRLDSVLKETENLKDSSGKMEQMGVEYRRLEDENVQLIEGMEKLREEIVSLKKENDLLRRACQQLRGRKSITEEKFTADTSNSELNSEPFPRKSSLNKPLLQKFQPIQERVSVEETNELNAMSGREPHEPRRRSYDPVPRDIKLSKGSLAPMPPWTGEGRGRQTQRGPPRDRQRSNSSPAVKRFPETPQTRRDASPNPKGPSPPSTDSSRSSETDRSVCSRSSYCSPILSLVDTCPLHRNPSTERPPNQCPICKKERRRPGMAPKEYVTLEKYV